MTTILSLILTYPLVLGYGGRMQKNLDGSFLGKASQNEAIIDCELASAIIFLPPALDSLLDCLFNKVDAAALEKVVILFGYLLTFSCQYISSYFDRGAAVYLVCGLIQAFLAVCIALSALSRACPHIRARASLLVVVLLFISFFASLYNFTFSGNSIDITASVFFFASMAAFISVLLNHVIRELIAIYRSAQGFMQYFKSIGENERYGFIAAVISLVIITTYAVLIAVYADSVVSTQSSGQQYLLFLNIMSIIFALFVILVPQRFIKRHSNELTNVLDAKKTFVRYISHELRTPLSIINTGLDVVTTLLNEQNYDEAKETISDLHFPARTAVDLLNDLLAYEKLDSGLAVIEATLQDPLVFVNDTLHPFYLCARSKNITLNVTSDVGVNSCYVYIDENKMAQVFRNLLSNAIKFTPIDGTVYIHTQLRDGFFEVSVKDNGTGISAENQSKLFANVIQFNARVQQGGGGSGLGLWISKKIMDLHRGFIKVSCKGEGFGSIFSFTIPLATEADVVRLRAAIPSVTSENLRKALSSVRIVPETPPLAVDSVGNDRVALPLFNCGQEHFPGNVDNFAPAGGNLIGKLRVLVVDDSALNRKLLVRRFQQEGYECVEADDGDTAVERAKEGVFDVITMDNMMPRMRGTIASATIRGLGYQGVIIGVTGNALEDDVADFKKHGVDVVMPKPFEIAAFKKHYMRLSALNITMEVGLE